jgi:hypothetical protein
MKVFINTCLRQSVDSRFEELILKRWQFLSGCGEDVYARYVEEVSRAELTTDSAMHGEIWELLVSRNDAFQTGVCTTV